MPLGGSAQHVELLLQVSATLEGGRASRHRLARLGELLLERSLRLLAKHHAMPGAHVPPSEKQAAYNIVDNGRNIVSSQ